MNTVIIEDEERNAAHLKRLLAKHCPAIEVVDVAMNADEGIASIIHHKPDVVFLDIELGNHTAFDVLNETGQYAFEVIFVTAHDRYAVRAIRCSALDYILKPIKPHELIAAVDKAMLRAGEIQSSQRIENFIHQMSHPDKSEHFIALPFLKEYRYVRPAEIIRCEALKSYTVFFLENGEKLTVTRLLRDYEEMLTPYHFIRCHQSHLVNRKFIRSLTKDDMVSELVLRDKSRVPVARQRRSVVKEMLEPGNLFAPSSIPPTTQFKVNQKHLQPGVCG